MRTSALIPAALMEAANARLEFDVDGNPTGFGPDNFSVPLGVEGGDATFAGLSCGNVKGFLDLLLEMEASGDFPGLVIEYEGKADADPEKPKSKGDFDKMVEAEALKKWDGIIENLPMTGDERTFGGKTWVSLTDFNSWQPPVAWREVVAEGYPEWVQPVGAVDAYKLGDRVTYKKKDYENLIAANVWSPSVYPAGWKLI